MKHFSCSALESEHEYTNRYDTQKQMFHEKKKKLENAQW